MILARPVKRWVGQTVVAIEPLQGRDSNPPTLLMTRGVRITFASGEVLLLKSDHYGRDCYISEHEPSESLNEVPLNGGSPTA